MGKISVDADVAREKTIRRYMSFQNFERLIKSQTMYFSRFDSFDDHLEGGINKRNFSSISNSLEILDSMNLSWPGIHPRGEQELAELQKVQNEIQNHICQSASNSFQVTASKTFQLATRFSSVSCAV